MNPIRFILIFCASILSGIACSTADTSFNSPVDNKTYAGDSYGVTRMPSLFGYDYITVSQLSGQTSQTTDSDNYTKISNTSHGKWRWSIYSENYLSAADQRDTRIAVVKKWQAVFSVYRETARTILGESAPPLDLELYLVPPDSKLRTSEHRFSATHFPFRFYFDKLPAGAADNDSILNDALIKILQTASHEHAHAWLSLPKNRKNAPNYLSEEVMANLFEICIATPAARAIGQEIDYQMNINGVATRNPTQSDFDSMKPRRSSKGNWYYDNYQLVWLSLNNALNNGSMRINSERDISKVVSMCSDVFNTGHDFQTGPYQPGAH